MNRMVGIDPGDSRLGGKIVSPYTTNSKQDVGDKGTRAPGKRFEKEGEIVLYVMILVPFI